MSKFVNLRKPDQEPFVVNVNGLSVVSTKTYKDNPDKNSITIAREGIGKGLPMITKDWDIDVNYALGQIASSGFEVYMLPNTNLDEGRIGSHYVIPSMVQAVEVFECKVRHEDGEPKSTMFVDVDGCGRIATSDMTLPSIESFLRATKKDVPSMIDFRKNNDVPSDGFYAIDMKAVRFLRASRHDTTISLKSGNRLHPDLRNRCSDNETRTDYLDRLAERVKNISGEDLLETHKGDKLPRLYQAMQKFEDRQIHRITKNFLGAAAANTPDLVHIEHAKDPTYVDMGSVSEIHVRDRRLSVWFERLAGQHYNDDLQIDFHSEREASEALDDLMQRTYDGPI